MKFLLCLLITMLLIFIVQSWTSIEPVQMDPRDPNFCLSDDPLIGRLRLGESKSLHPNQCVRVTCQQGLMGRAGCSKIVVSPPYVIGSEDLTQPYPKCCPKAVLLDGDFLTSANM